MIHRTPHILANPSMPDYEGMTEHLQEMTRGQARAQDVCRKLCERVPCGVNPGASMKTPEDLKVGDLVLVRRNIVATNTINSILKLTRIYSSKAYRIASMAGNHFSVEIDRVEHVYHRKRLRKVVQQV
jgi:hypothetical protein